MNNFPSNRHGNRLRRKVRLTIDEIHRTTFPKKERVPVPLHLYLEEQKDPPQTQEVGIQADELKPRKPVAKYVPPKTGFDVGIQIDESNVYDFDRDVMPIVNIIVDKTIEQAYTEVTREMVNKILKRQKDELDLSKRTREKEIADRIKEEQRIRQEKNERKRKSKEKSKRIKSLLYKIETFRDVGIISRDLTKSCAKHKQYLNLHYSHDELLVKDVVLPELYQNVFKKLQTSKLSRKIVNDIMESAFNNITNLIEEGKREMEKIRIRLRIEGFNEIGPLILESSGKIIDLRTLVLEWIKEHPEDFPALNKAPLIELDSVKIFVDDNEAQDGESVKSFNEKKLIVRLQHEKTEEDQNPENEEEIETSPQEEN